MADEISFALILSKNLKQNNRKGTLKLSQIELVVKVTEGMDPLTLQQLRDAGNTSFQARRKNLNDFIEKSEALLAKQKDEQKRKKMATDIIKAMDKQVRVFEKNLTQRVEKFCDDEEKKNAEFEKGNVKFACSCLWSMAGIVKDTVGGITALFASAAVPAASVAGAKAIADLLLDIKGLYKTLSDAYKSGADVHADIMKGMKKIKATKPPKTIGASLIKNVESNIELFGSKIDAAEMHAKALAKKVNGVLNFAEKNSDISKDAKKRIKTFVDENLKEIVRITTAMKKAKRDQQSFGDKLANAQKRSKTDARSIFDWAVSFYEMGNKLFTWTVEWDDLWNQADKLITLTTTDDFFEPVQVG